MKWMTLVLLAALATGCASSSSGRDYDSDARRRAEAKRELERECRLAAQTRTYNPDCPETGYGPPGAERSPLPDVRLPGR